MSNSHPQRESATDAQSLLFDPAYQSHQEQNWHECFPEFIGRSPQMLRVLETLYKVASSDSAVLISGESGTGKELIAAALHRLSNRSHKKFVPINCSAIPENLLESELFGHEKGAFTGAINRRVGHFENADGGTLFLDEIGDMSAHLQAKLLRVLQEKQFTSVGGHQLKSANVRVIAASNIVLADAVKAGKFRLDLYYRLNVLPIHLPPLRERRGDVAALLNHFLAQSNRLHSHEQDCFFSTEVLEQLAVYHWPGNVRELQNVVERLVVLRRGGEIRLEHLPPEYLKGQGGASEIEVSLPVEKTNQRAVTYPREFGLLPDQGLNLPSYIENLENTLIMQALERTGHNKNKAARLLGLNRTTLVERIKKRKIAPLNAASKDE